MAKSAGKDDKWQSSDDVQLSETRIRESWVQPLAEAIKRSVRSIESRMHTTLWCDSKSKTTTFYLPRNTEKMHPRFPRYIQTFSTANGFKLGRNKRNSQIQPLRELRDRKPPMIALGLSLLLKQTGLPGAARTLSKPHTLAPESELISLRELIKMAAFATPNAKRVVVLPNRILTNTLQDTQSICCYASKIKHSGKTTLLSHFDSPMFRAIGYVSGDQFIAHIFLAGGLREKSSLWTQIPAFTNSEFNFQLFPGRRAEDDFGLFYATFYLNLALESTH